MCKLQRDAGHDAVQGNADPGLGLTLIWIVGGTGLQFCLNPSMGIAEPVKARVQDGVDEQNQAYYSGVYGLAAGFLGWPGVVTQIEAVHLSLF